MNVFALWGQCLQTDLSSKSSENAYDLFPFPRTFNAVIDTCPWENPLVLIVCIHLQNSYSATSIQPKPVLVWPADGSLCKLWSHPVWTSWPQKSQQERAADSAVGIHPKICHLIYMNSTSQNLRRVTTSAKIGYNGSEDIGLRNGSSTNSSLLSMLRRMPDTSPTYL